jgi:diphthamide synthase (EF-2-diphthine--ammonia ligase)
MERNTIELANTFVDLGFKAVVTCIDSEFLDKAFVGRLFDKQFLSELPSNVDPCGENGESHSSVYGGPIFQKSLSFKLGDVVLRDNRFHFCDLVPFQNGISVISDDAPLRTS